MLRFSFCRLSSVGQLQKNMKVKKRKKKIEIELEHGNLIIKLIERNTFNFYENYFQFFSLLVVICGEHDGMKFNFE